MYFFIFIIFFILICILAFNGMMMRQENFICSNCLNVSNKNEPCNCSGCNCSGYKSCEDC